MHITDPIADMLTRIRNANSAKHDTVDIPASKMKKQLLRFLLMKVISKLIKLLMMINRALSVFPLNMVRANHR